MAGFNHQSLMVLTTPHPLLASLFVLGSIRLLLHYCHAGSLPPLEYVYAEFCAWTVVCNQSIINFLCHLLSFVKGLTLLDKDFRQAVRSANNAHEKTVLSEESLKLILGNVSSLLNLNSGMLQELEERMSKW